LYLGSGPGSLTWQNEKKVGAGEDKKVSPADCGEGRWCDFRNHEAILSQSVRLQDLVKHAGVDWWTHLKIHALPVLIAVIGTLTMSGLISLA
jgi:hypothetical protein